MTNAESVWQEVYGHIGHMSCEELVEQTGKEGEWGGEEQIVIAAAILGAAIEVHTIDMPVLRYGEGAQVIQLLYTGTEHEKNHYDLILGQAAWCGC